MSVLNKIWQLKNNQPSLSLTEKLLHNRGLASEDAAERFLNPSRERDFHDPFLMRDMERAVERIGAAIERGERIMIFGDYDLDGITGTAILMRTLTKLGANISYRLPHRIEDGYGLRAKFIEAFHKLDVKLIVTVDNGISCFQEVALANEKGMDVIITDHHTVPEKIPNAYAILHPKLPNSGYPFDELTGSAVALKFAQALLMRRTKNHEEEVEKMLDLACIGTIGDFGPLIGENRYIVKEGLRVLNTTRWPGLSKLKKIAGVNGVVNTQDIGFLMGPRLNAAGRMSHANDALNLLLHGEDKSDALAKNLDALNKERQKLTEKLMKLVRKQADVQRDLPIIIVHHAEFHAGVIGILAAKIVETYGKPAIVMEEREVSAIGSCRSVEGFNIVDALGAAREYLTHFGGHAAAAGFEVERMHLEKFKEKVQQFADEFAHTLNIPSKLEVECALAQHDITMQTYELLQSFQPFGAGNEHPRFLCEGLIVKNFKTVGADKKHLKLGVRPANDGAGANGSGHRQGGAGTLDCIGFRLGAFANQLTVGAPIDIVAELDENIWQGRRSLQLRMIDFKC
ncbi:single-stranded-DNA-specific exonuclease RecJ [Candidatus Peregrinibacteria bacterium CG11_big_fil_rev_8_21_14_0_20_46_8]|nr:MAG: single-stranded-DNA-specific exonuclease RecJ [Candidatus Peregrinibacteria bacterium CG11_big_fil_rev_8_21_14_0_20_46_8]